MSAPSSTTTRVPSIGRRSLARGSALGVGLLVAAGAFAPAALAEEEPTGDIPAPEADLGTGEVQPVPINDDPTEGDEGADTARPGASLEGFFGRGKSVGFQVTYDDATAPADLDLSGAVFTLTGASGTFSCTTGTDGYCAVPSGSGTGPLVAGDFAVTQTGHPVGLAAASGVGSVHLCDWTDFMFGRGCPTDPFEPVVNDSVFRSPVVTSVEDAVTSAPIAGAEYTLTGPSYPALVTAEESDGDSGDQAGVLAAAQSAVDGPLLQTARATSDADGGLTFNGWFLPGTEYVLAPASTVDGYLADTETPGIEVAPSSGVLAASLAPRRLTPIVVPAPVNPDTTPIAPPAPPAPGPVATPADGGVPAGSARPGRAATPAPAAPAEPTVAEPSAPAVPSPPRTFDRSGAAEPTLPPVAGVVTAPALTTVSSNLPDKGLAMALGGVFLIVILAAIGLVRRRARRRA